MCPLPCWGYRLHEATLHPMLSMSRPLFAHIAALRRQIRRIQGAALFGAVAMLPCAVILLTTAEAGWLPLVLLLVLGGYLQRKVRRVLWARHAVKQLRLEEQFVRHGPAPEDVLTCMRRYNHLWTQSLTLKGLKGLRKNHPAASLPAPARQARVGQHYTQAFESLRPSRVPADLIWLAAVGLLWLWFAPEALLQTMTPPVFVGLALLLVILVAEAVQAILCADVRDGIAHVADLLSTWTLTPAFETLFAVHAKPYRHTALYRSWMVPPTTTKAAPVETGAALV